MNIEEITDDQLWAEISSREKLLQEMVGSLYPGIVQEEVKALRFRYESLIAHEYHAEEEVTDAQLEVQIGLRIGIAQRHPDPLTQRKLMAEAGRLAERLNAAEAYKLEHPGLTIDPNDPELKQGGVDGQQDVYLVMSDEELAKGFVRPVRTKYKHQKCWTVTTMGQKLAETWARDPKFYGATYCSTCVGHYPANMFWWINADGTETKEELGT